MSKRIKRIKYEDLTQEVTVTVGDLAAIIHKAEHKRGITVRLRTATIAMFEFGGTSTTKNGSVWLSIGVCLSNPRYRGGSYMPLSPDHLVDVGTTAEAHGDLVEALEAKAQPVRGIWDMYLGDLDAPYRKEGVA